MRLCMPRVVGLLREVGRLFLTYLLIYQQIFLGIVWANDGLCLIQADLDEIRHQGGVYVSKTSPSSSISFSTESVQIREEFKTCDWVFRESQGHLQTFYRWQDSFYEVHHPSLLKSVQVLKSTEDGESNTLYIKLLREGLGQKNTTIGLESEREIIIEDGIQLKGLVTYSPRVVSRAMAPWDSKFKVKGIDVEDLRVHGDFKVEGGSTLNVKALHLYEGIFFNQGTLKFKEGGTAHLYGNDLINDHKIKGIKQLTFYEGGVFDHRRSLSQLRVKEGQFFYEGQKLVSSPDSRLEARKIHVKTHHELTSLPHLKGDQLCLEATSLEGCDLKTLTTFKKLRLLSTASPLTFSDPLVFEGSLKAEAPLVKNVKGIGSKGDIELKAPQILNEAFLISKRGKVMLEGNVQHLKGLLGARKGVELRGETHTLRGDLHPTTALTIQSKQGFTYDPYKLKTENLLKLIFQEVTTLGQEIKTPGILQLEGPSLILTSLIETLHLEASSPLLKIKTAFLSPSLKAWGDVEVTSSSFTAEKDLDVEGNLKISASGPIHLKGPVVGKQDMTIVGKEVRAEQELLADKTLAVTAQGNIFFKERAVGREGIILTTGGELDYKEGGQDATPETSGLQTLGFLDINSTAPMLFLRHSLSLLGRLIVRGAQVLNFVPLNAKQGFIFLTNPASGGFGLINRGKILSKAGPLYVEGSTYHDAEAEILISNKAYFTGVMNYFHGPITAKEGLNVHTTHEGGLRYSPTVFSPCPEVTFSFEKATCLMQELTSPNTRLTLEGSSFTFTQPLQVQELIGQTSTLVFKTQDPLTLSAPVKTSGHLIVHAPSLIVEKDLQAQSLEIKVKSPEQISNYSLHALRTSGLLKLIFSQGGVLSHPLNVAGALEIEVLPSQSTDFKIRANLKADKGIRLRGLHSFDILRDINGGFVKLESGDYFEVEAKAFRNISGGIFSNGFFHIKVEDDLQLGEWRSRLKQIPVNREIFGHEFKENLGYSELVESGSYFTSNSGMKLEAERFNVYASKIIGCRQTSRYHHV